MLFAPSLTNQSPNEHQLLRTQVAQYQGHEVAPWQRLAAHPPENQSPYLQHRHQQHQQHSSPRTAFPAPPSHPQGYRNGEAVEQGATVRPGTRQPYLEQQPDIQHMLGADPRHLHSSGGMVGGTFHHSLYGNGGVREEALPRHPHTSHTQAFGGLSSVGGGADATAPLLELASRGYLPGSAHAGVDANSNSAKSNSVVERTVLSSPPPLMPLPPPLFISPERRYVGAGGASAWEGAVEGWERGQAAR